jgi:hypothetical protein
MGSAIGDNDFSAGGSYSKLLIITTIFLMLDCPFMFGMDAVSSMMPQSKPQTPH